jgi:hypothetical protein
MRWIAARLPGPAKRSTSGATNYMALLCGAEARAARWPPPRLRALFHFWQLRGIAGPHGVARMERLSTAVMKVLLDVCRLRMHREKGVFGVDAGEGLAKRFGHEENPHFHQN